MNEVLYINFQLSMFFNFFFDISFCKSTENKVKIKYLNFLHNYPHTKKNSTGKKFVYLIKKPGTANGSSGKRR